MKGMEGDRQSRRKFERHDALVGDNILTTGLQVSSMGMQCETDGCERLSIRDGIRLELDKGHNEVSLGGQMLHSI